MIYFNIATSLKICFFFFLFFNFSLIPMYNSLKAIECTTENFIHQHICNSILLMEFMKYQCFITLEINSAIAYYSIDSIWIETEYNYVFFGEETNWITVIYTNRMSWASTLYWKQKSLIYTHILLLFIKFNMYNTNRMEVSKRKHSLIRFRWISMNQKSAKMRMNIKCMWERIYRKIKQKPFSHFIYWNSIKGIYG